jgi:glutamate-ammonia-ligase adenylyltransferase
MHFTAAEQSRHAELLAEISAANPVRVAAEAAGDEWRVTVVGEDRPGDLSMTCGLLFVYGFDILQGFVSTRLTAERPVFVNTFMVRPPFAPLAPEVWLNFELDLRELFLLARTGAPGAAQGNLAKRVAAALDGFAEAPRKPSPMQIEFDNSGSPLGTVLELRAEDSLGFLYELTNALALCDIDIKAMRIRTQGSRVADTLCITDARQGGKITSRQRLDELHAAIVLIKQFTHLLPHAPNPEAALLHFRNFLAEWFRQPNWTQELASLERPDVLDALARVLGVSDFLWNDLLRLQHAALFPLLKNLAGLEHAKSRDALAAELNAELRAACTLDERRRKLNAFKDREMFRVDMRHILRRIAEFRSFSEELSDIAEVVVQVVCHFCQEELAARYGEPRLESQRSCRFVAAAVGKFGGRELGYASDIELLFVYEADGETDGRERIVNAAYFQKLVELFTASIEAREEGIFQVDLRLRPYGRGGSLAMPWSMFERYFAPNGPAWPYERQALVKLRPVAGDEIFGRELIELRDRLIYVDQPIDPLPMQALRERQVRQLVQAGTFNAKLSPGGLVDIEYLVQTLQLQYGHSSPALRTPSTEEALQALCQAGHLARGDVEQLQTAYRFLRRLIDALRMVRGNAQDLTVPPRHTEEFEFLSRRLDYAGDSGGLQADLERHNQAVLSLLRRFREIESSEP